MIGGHMGERGNGIFQIHQRGISPYARTNANSFK